MKFTVRLDRISLLMLLAWMLEDRMAQTFSLLIAALLHECGHLLVARWLHISITSLHISVLGARLELGDPLLSYQREWLLCAGGPLFSVLLAAVAAILSSRLPHTDFLTLLAPTSLALGLINLLPVGWLDGGRMFRAVCRLILPHVLATRIIRITSLAFLLLLWMTSVYLLLRVGNSLSLFVFSFSLFLRFFPLGQE